MDIHVSKERWTNALKGWFITDCSVRSREILYVVARQNVSVEEASLMWDHDIPSRFYVLYLYKDRSKTFGWREFEGLNKPMVGVAEKPIPRGFIVARNHDGQVFAVGGGAEMAEEFIAPGQGPMTERIKCINGYAYSVGGYREIYKRTDIDKWERFADLPRSGDDVFAVGFNDMDAFSETDMYAVGGHGDVWHFDGKKWMQMGFPSNVTLGTVTCAGDGKVYISGEGGSLWRGRESTWEPIYKGGSSILWNDVIWFEDKLWLASDYQLRIWNGKELTKVMDGDKPVPIYGHMDARDGLLMVASPDVVMAYDGKEWRILIAPYFD
jgi:hypothetical protein